MITRPFSSPMVMMCHEVHACINSNIMHLHLQNVDTSTVPNHLSILPYMAIPSLKPRSTISLHTDIFIVVMVTIICCQIVNVKIQQL